MNQDKPDRQFIRTHADDDVRQLALQASRYSDVDMPWALDQIAGRQTARRKLPSWAAIDDIIYPPHISMEQCSSEFTARYKAEVAARLMLGSGRLPSGTEADAEEEKRTTLVDLTGGFGVDFSFMARGFDEAVYVERQRHLCDAATSNFRLLDLPQAKVVCGDGVDYLHSLTCASLIFLDPARRDANGGKTVAISDCTPDVLAMKEELLSKSQYVMLKLSPMLDWHKAVDDLGNVAELHIVSSGNECKELLLVLSASYDGPLSIYCVNDGDVLNYSLSTDVAAVPISDEIPVGSYLYEPNASAMKAGCFGVLCARYGVKGVGCNSHLFVSPDEIGDFPGRKFQISAISSMNKKELKRNLLGMEKANIAVRNFPMSVAELRKRLNLKDGGDAYLFATTIGDREHVIIVCRKR